MGVVVEEKCPNCQETVFMPINCPQICQGRSKNVPA